MTEYGRGAGSEPWHPEDPLYGDGGWGGQQAGTAQSAYGGQPGHYPQQPQQYGDWGPGQQAAYGGPQQQPPGYDPRQQQGGYGGQQPGGYDGQPGGYDAQQPGGGWETGQHAHVPYGADPTDPYGGQGGAYGGEHQDYYRTSEAYPPPEPPARRRPVPEPEIDWDPGPDQGEHAFFAGGGDDDDRDDDTHGRRGRRDRRGRGGGARKRRSGCACLVVVLVFGGGIGGVGYFGYQFYQDRFGSAPDYAGNGTGEKVTVEIPKGAGGYEIGQALKKAGVVKSVDAFVAAQAENPDGNTIQAGIYTLNSKMSAAAAVELMLSPKSRNNLIIPEGQRNSWVYAEIDKRLELKNGTTASVAKKEWKSLGLPDWANNNKDIKDPLEGFLYPSAYPVAKGMKPEVVLKGMVKLATEKYDELGLKEKADGLNLDNPLQVVTVASLVQAEGKTRDDYRKMAEVVFNRLKPTNTETYQLLQFDSTFNYLKGQSNINISESEINSNQDPYNTYTQKGLPPGPIDNPGEDALEAALDPTSDGWVYFVATDGQQKTEFAKTHAEFLKLKEKFNESAGR